VRDPGAQDLGSMRHRAEQVGPSAAFLQIDVMNLCGFLIDLLFFRGV
jgi:hypothetical protein